MGIRTMTSHNIALTFLLAILSVPASSAQTAPPVDQKTDPKTVPVIDAGLGPCSADFTITDATTAPVYDAKVRVHIAYGFMNLHKLDLEVGTNAAGKARFTGLPDRTKQGLFFRASQGDSQGSAFDDPAKNLQGRLHHHAREEIPVNTFERIDEHSNQSLRGYPV
jgi:hypothetical protein